MHEYDTLIIDIDNTLTKLQPTLDKISEVAGVSKVLESEVTTFSLGNFMGVELEEDSNFWENYEPELIRTAEVAQERVERLLSKIRYKHLIVVSNRPTALLRASVEWFKAKGISYDKIHCIGEQDKAKFVKDNYPEAEAIIEDNPEVIQGIMDYNKQGKLDIDVWVVDYLYNKSVEGTQRVDYYGNLMS